MSEVNPLWLIVAASAVAIIPILLGVATSYVKVSIVLTMVRNALGTQQVPGHLVIMALSLSLTLFIMGPVIDRTVEKGRGIDFTALIRGSTAPRAFAKAAELIDPWREFMRGHANAREIEALAAIEANRRGGESQRETAETLSKDPPLSILLPAFVLSELREAFTMGFLVLLPFLVIDLIVANILAGMGMFMMSPVLISLPIKLLLFVLSDAWLVIIRGLILSYQ